MCFFFEFKCAHANIKAFLPTNNRYVNKLLILQILQLNQNGTLSGLPGKNNVELIVIEYYPHAASLIKIK